MLQYIYSRTVGALVENELSERKEKFTVLSVAETPLPCPRACSHTISVSYNLVLHSQIIFFPEHIKWNTAFMGSKPRI